MRRILAVICAAVLPGWLAAAELVLPAGAVAVSERATALGVYQLPAGPEAADKVPSQRFEGRILRRTWRLEGQAAVLQILAPLREQLLAQGYEVLLDCAARDCGGFGFRFGIEVVPSPDMMVDISAYHFLSAVKAERAVSVLVSQSGGAAYLQVIDVAPPAAGPAIMKPAQQALVEELPLELAKVLEVQGHTALRDLEFQSGSARLGERDYASLRDLAAVLEANPGYRILLVGHTDTVGGLKQNIAISKRRAGSVKARMVESLGVDSGRIDVAGAGYLAPIASNRTPEGREVNRRVEAVLISN
ncbi:OmpA family protein [Leisingera sp. ANG-M1]|uniref:OmpA family protein n=1 Tax=Leisingera sp. ANG-M1 TaxID=1577895 RepID=UPI00267E0DFD